VPADAFTAGRVAPYGKLSVMMALSLREPTSLFAVASAKRNREGRNAQSAGQQHSWPDGAYLSMVTPKSLVLPIELLEF
jgi:hypothetical protein